MINPGHDRHLHRVRSQGIENILLLRLFCLLVIANIASVCYIKFTVCYTKGRNFSFYRLITRKVTMKFLEYETFSQFVFFSFPFLFPSLSFRILRAKGCLIRRMLHRLATEYDKCERFLFNGSTISLPLLVAFHKLDATRKSTCLLSFLNFLS